MFSGVLSVCLQAQMSGALDIERLTSNVDQSWSVQWGDGGGANLAKRMWTDRRTLASGASETLDLSGPGLKDAFGDNLVLDKVKAIIVVGAADNTTVLTVGNVANGLIAPFLAASDGVIVPPGGIFLCATPDTDGFGVVAGTRDLLRIANAAGAAATYDVAIVGA